MGDVTGNDTPDGDDQMTRETTEADFFATIGKLNCHPRIEGQYPYTSFFLTPQHVEVGRIVRYIPDGKALPESRYILPR
jgi:hypothetical protein